MSFCRFDPWILRTREINKPLHEQSCVFLTNYSSLLYLNPEFGNLGTLRLIVTDLVVFIAQTIENLKLFSCVPTKNKETSSTIARD